MGKAARVTKQEYEALAGLRFSLRQFLHFSEEAARKAGITPQQHQALLAIKGYPERDSITVGELAERLQTRHHSAVGLVARLIAAKLISRKVSAKDRRCMLLTLTQNGEKILASLSAEHKEQLRRVGPRMEYFLKLVRG